MGIDRQHREVKRFIGCCFLFQGIFCKIKQLFILKSPEYTVPLRNQTIFRTVIIIHYVIISMFFKVQFSSAECTIGSDQKRLVVSGIIEDISKRCKTREEFILRIHRVSFNRNL